MQVTLTTKRKKVADLLRWDNRLPHIDVMDKYVSFTVHTMQELHDAMDILRDEYDVMEVKISTEQ